MVRWLILLLGMVTTRTGSSYRASEGGWREPDDYEELDGHDPDDRWVTARDPVAPVRPTRVVDRRDWGQPELPRRARRRLVPRWLKWAAVLALAALVFRKVIAFA